MCDLVQAVTSENEGSVRATLKAHRWVAGCAMLVDAHAVHIAAHASHFLVCVHVCVHVYAYVCVHRDKYNGEDAEREAALEAAIAAVRQGSSENKLDQQVGHTHTHTRTHTHTHARVPTVIAEQCLHTYVPVFVYIYTCPCVHVRVCVCVLNRCLQR